MPLRPSARPVAPGHRRGPALGLAGGRLLLLCPPGPRAAEASCPYRWPGPCCSPHLTFFFFLVVLYNFVEESFALRQSTPCIDAHESLFSDAHSTISVFLLLSWLPPWTCGFLGALAAKKTARSCSHVTVCMSSHSGAHVSGTARSRMLPECPRVPGARHTARGPRGSVGFGARATC